MVRDGCDDPPPFVSSRHVGDRASSSTLIKMFVGSLFYNEEYCNTPFTCLLFAVLANSPAQTVTPLPIRCNAAKKITRPIFRNADEQTGQLDIYYNGQWVKCINFPMFSWTFNWNWWLIMKYNITVPLERTFRKNIFINGLSEPGLSYSQCPRPDEYKQPSWLVILHR